MRHYSLLAHWGWLESIRRFLKPVLHYRLPGDLVVRVAWRWRRRQLCVDWHHAAAMVRNYSEHVLLTGVPDPERLEKACLPQRATRLPPKLPSLQPRRTRNSITSTSSMLKCLNLCTLRWKRRHQVANKPPAELIFSNFGTFRLMSADWPNLCDKLNTRLIYGWLNRGKKCGWSEAVTED